ncbi:26S proteasome non-ATPase regulatory subunit 6-like protein [Rozella allomycis CSF55]|uniref:26S proteasome non-ATPase regulatory subunit 6-like protein n=1 Tax=Rozella allomycis (strain CSF55) TaxID=988480 RepID=A0A075AMT1_ROZAC|nr:26S proteasome, regulatory subunit Rpn7 domain-containing protein [Rozella allomycis CSF55]RKP21918.1 26S proteasome non-ATPase regulatory subunit 6-like protein [Rozella allomycis CSF55]|eukprot:EPZ30991.1 26S proteasome, regulatory subunit Rpn7 domain-containing protein [Rozella allomycis CSF55]
MVEEANTLNKIPNLKLAQLKFLYIHQGHNPAIKEQIMTLVKDNFMAPYYSHICTELKWPVDAALLNQLSAKNETDLKNCEEKKIDAEKNLGDTEVLDAMILKADYLCQIGDKDGAIAAYAAVAEKTGSLGTKLDVAFSQIRLGFLYSDAELINKNIEKAKSLLESGGDWDRKNRLKVYEGLYAMSTRDFHTAADKFLDALATFTCTELLEYKEFIKYTIICALIAVDRIGIRKKLINAPEVLEVIHEISPLDSYMNSLYNCQYKEFFIALAKLETLLKSDRYLYPHYKYIVKEMKIKAYSQLLESYKSLSLKSMADAFGVTLDFIDRELCRFIAAGRLNCVIDKVSLIVETNRPDHKNAQYQIMIKHGDVLLNRVQKLSRVTQL